MSQNIAAFLLSIQGSKLIAYGKEDYSKNVP
jgi:hypothetical protein